MKSEVPKVKDLLIVQCVVVRHCLIMKIENGKSYFFDVGEFDDSAATSTFLKWLEVVLTAMYTS